MLAPLYNAIQNVLTRLTTTRAANLDKLDANISTRAASSTALSNATWSDARAGKIDNLDAAISTRAPSSTALSTATWTPTKAGYLDAAISSRSTLTANDVWGAGTRTLTALPSVIKSYQTGFAALSARGNGEDVRYNDITISSVDINKCIVIINYHGGNGVIGATGRLTSNTNLRISSGSESGIYLRWQVIEFA